MIIKIIGSASCGKTTLANKLAEMLTLEGRTVTIIEDYFAKLPMHKPKGVVILTGAIDVKPQWSNDESTIRHEEQE